MREELWEPIMGWPQRMQMLTQMRRGMVLGMGITHPTLTTGVPSMVRDDRACREGVFLSPKDQPGMALAPAVMFLVSQIGLRGISGTQKRGLLFRGDQPATGLTTR